MPLTAGVPLGDRVVLLAGPVAAGGGLLRAPSPGCAWWIRAWRWTGWTGTCRVCRRSGIRRGLCGGAAAAGYGDAGFIPGLIQPGMMRPGTPFARKIGLPRKIRATGGDQSFRGSRIFRDLFKRGGCGRGRGGGGAGGGGRGGGGGGGGGGWRGGGGGAAGGAGGGPGPAHCPGR